jgi:hypothetical protein
MDHLRIIKRAWSILWGYRTLWIFGIILALTAGANFRGANNRISYQHPESSFTFPGSQDFTRDMEQLSRLITGRLTPQFWQTLIWVILVVVVFFLLLAIAFAIGRYVSQVALIRMVARYETSQEKVNWKKGFGLGWSKAAWRLFLINLVISLPVAIVFLVLIIGAALPVLSSALAGNQPSVIGVVATIGLVFLVIFLAIVVCVALGLIMEIIRRECVLQEVGVVASIRQGWRIVRRNFKDVVLFWLLLLGIKIGYFILMIPVMLLLIGVGVLLGGGIGLHIGLLGRSIIGGSASWLPAVILGGLVFLIVLGLPMLFLGGLRETYLSTGWTLAYRQLTPTAPLEITDAVDSPAALDISSS